MLQGSGTLKNKNKQKNLESKAQLDRFGFSLDKRWTTFIITAAYNCIFFLLQYNIRIEE